MAVKLLSSEDALVAAGKDSPAEETAPPVLYSVFSKSQTWCFLSQPYYLKLYHITLFLFPVLFSG